MTIAVNGIYLKSSATGIANVLIKTVNVWATWQNVKVIIYINTNLAPGVAERLDKNIEVRILPFLFAKDNSTLWFLFKFGFIINKTKPELLWSPAPWLPFGLSRKQKTLIDVNDFVSRDFKSTMRPVNRFVFSLIERHSINRTDFLWVISNYTRDKLYEYYPKSVKKPLFVGCGTDDGIKERSICTDEERKMINKKLSIKAPYMLFVGTLEPRKNLKYLLTIYPALFDRTKLDLIVVGARGWGKTDIKEIINNPDFPKTHVFLEGYVTDDQLAKLYSGAQFFISTSLNEGFGLPQVEAMTCGCPVVTSNNSAMTEVSKDAGVLVDGWDEEDWVNAAKYAIEHKSEIIERQNKRAVQYEWQNIMKELYVFMKENNML